MEKAILAILGGIVGLIGGAISASFYVGNLENKVLTNTVLLTKLEEKSDSFIEVERILIRMDGNLRKLREAQLLESEERLRRHMNTLVKEHGERARMPGGIQAIHDNYNIRLTEISREKFILQSKEQIRILGPG